METEKFLITYAKAMAICLENGDIEAAKDFLSAMYSRAKADWNYDAAWRDIIRQK